MSFGGFLINTSGGSADFAFIDLILACKGYCVLLIWGDFAVEISFRN